MFARVLAACLGVLSLASPAPAAEPVRVMSFNIRYGSANDGANSWDQRREFLVDTIRAFRPELLGTQETLANQRNYLAQALPEYMALGVGRDDGREVGEMMAIYIRKDRFEVRQSGHFWLSETPDIAGSKSWDAALPRMVTWAELADRQAASAPPLLWMNTHFDHIGAEARRQAARLLRARVQAASGKAVVVTGDFNSQEGSEPWNALFGPVDGQPSPLRDSFRAIPKDRQRFENVGTFSGFKAANRGGDRIDWIGVTSHFDVKSSDIDYTERNGRTPSDHFPVTAVLQWTSANSEPANR